MSHHENVLTKIAAKVMNGSSHCLDLWQRRDWPHRRGDEIRLDLHTMPLPQSSPGQRGHPCEKCNQPCQCIQDNVLCWKCKGTFCAFCIASNPNLLMAIKMETVLKDGFGKCPACQEPLRSIGLIDVFRSSMEQMSVGDKHLGNGMIGISKENSTNLNTMFGSKQGQSLVQEAEQALQRARSLRDGSNGKDDKMKLAAIEEYTHAINAIMYFASTTGGNGLVLRPHDLLLIAHCERADLEGNLELADAIVASYPKASVRTEQEQEEQFHVSRAGFRSLFYPLPACLLVGSPPSTSKGLMCLDLRTDSKDYAFATSGTQKQFRLWERTNDLSFMKNQHPHCDGCDANFGSLRGSWQGLQSTGAHPMQHPEGLVSLQVDQESVPIANFIQFISVFPSATAAAEYTRIKFETKTIGEEKPPVSAQNSPRLVKMVKRKTKTLLPTSSCASTTAAISSREDHAIDLRQVHVIQGGPHGMPMTSIVAAIGNVSTKIFIACNGGSDKAISTLVARALVYLHSRLKNCRATTKSSAVAKVVQPCADLTLCAFCGQGPAQLKACTRCKAAKYCDADCQRNHWATKGPNSHKTMCKAVSSGAQA